MIMGWNLLTELGIVQDFSTQQIVWDGATVPMRSPHALNTNDAFVMYNEIYESTVVHEATSRLRAILDAKYEPADIDAITMIASG